MERRVNQALTPVRLVERVKTREQIRAMQTAGKALACWMANMHQVLADGNMLSCTPSWVVKTFTEHLENSACYPIFQNARHRQTDETYGYPICVSVNNRVVHGIPTSDIAFEFGDIIKIDAGLGYKGMCVDMARTIVYGSSLSEIASRFATERQDIYLRMIESVKLATAAYSALAQATRVCRAGNTINSIATEIARAADLFGVHVIDSHAGHGIGTSLHELPTIPNRPGLIPSMEAVELVPGMTICLEPILTLGDGRVETLEDNWTIQTVDGTIAAHVEDTILITKEEPFILTSREAENAIPYW